MTFIQTILYRATIAIVAGFLAPEEKLTFDIRVEAGFLERTDRLVGDGKHSRLPCD
jgi:hypothetical protein